MSPCDVYRNPNGGGVIVCSRSTKRQPNTTCQSCGEPGYLRCDFPMGDNKTCDAFICVACATHVGRNRDHCPKHAGAKP